MYVPIFEQSLEGHCAYYGILVSVHDQQWLVFHLVQNGLHGSRHLSALLAHQRPWPGILGEYVIATEKIPGAIIGLLVLNAVHQVQLQLFSRPGHDGLPSGEMVAHQAVQRVTLISGQGFPDGRPSRVPAQACPQLGDSSQTTCLARSVITVTQVRHGGGLVFFLPGHSGYDDVDYVAGVL